MRTAAEADSAQTESQKWLAAASDVDEVARIVIRYCLAVAAEAAIEKSREWVKLAAALERPDEPDVRIVRYVMNDRDDLSHAPTSDPQRERLEDMMHRLEAFMQLAKEISKHLNRQLDKSPATKPSGRGAGVRRPGARTKRAKPGQKEGRKRTR